MMQKSAVFFANVAFFMMEDDQYFYIDKNVWLFFSKSNSKSFIIIFQ